MVKKYRKKPVVIEAIQWTKDNAGEVDLFCCGKAALVLSPLPAAPLVFFIHTLEGTMKASLGDYIVKGVNGEFYPCKPDIFEKTYEDA